MPRRSVENAEEGFLGELVPAISLNLESFLRPLYRYLLPQSHFYDCLKTIIIYCWKDTFSILQYIPLSHFYY